MRFENGARALTKAILLDVDGTLVDSNEAHAAAWLRALAESGVAADAQVIRRSIGMGGDHILPELFGIDANSQAGRNISKLRTDIFRQNYLPTLKAFPGALDLLKAIHDSGLKRVIATSASAEDADLILNQCGLKPETDVITTSADAARSKPSPDIVLAALQKLGLSADEVIMLGDTPYDVIAAQQADVVIAGFESGGWSKAELMQAGAARTFKDPAQCLDSGLAFLKGRA